MITANDNEPVDDTIGIWFETMLQGMVDCSAITDDLRHSLSIEISDGIGWERGNQIREMLEQAMPHPITHGRFYNQTDIIRHLKEII